MQSERRILDIRYYESTVENVDGASLPGELGRTFKLPFGVHSLGARIARKLREYGFVTGSFDHLYVNFTTVLPNGEIRMSPRNPDNRIRYIDYGLTANHINERSDSEKESFVASSTFDILQFVAGSTASQLAMVDRIREDIERHGSTLEIKHKTKETQSYLITITYQIRPNGNRSVAFLRYVDKQSGRTSTTKLVDLNDYEDVYALVGTISVSRGVICLRPRPSFKASLYTGSYKVPIEIPIVSLGQDD